MAKKTVKPSIPLLPAFLADAINARLDDAAGSMKYPTLMQCLLPVYSEGALTRQAGRLTISVEGAHWRIKLDCPSEVIATSLACASLVDCLDVLETTLNNGQCVWVPGWKKNKKPLPVFDAIIQ